MIESTKGISLRYYKYSDRSVIAKIYTEEFGLQSYVMKGIRNKNSKNKLNLLQSLNIIQLEVTNNSKRNLQYVKEIRRDGDLSMIFRNMEKRFLCLFMSEILLKVLVDAEKDNSLFSFIEDTVISLNQPEKISKNFSLTFLLNLSHYLGFYPSKSDSRKEIFDLESGCFTDHSVYHNICGVNKNYFSSLLEKEEIDIPFQNRKELLKSIQKYYSLHHYNIESLKSYEVIESLRI